MARLPRFDLAGIAQHVVQRGNDRQPCFARDVDDQLDRQSALSTGARRGRVSA